MTHHKTYYKEAFEEVSEEIERRILMSKIEKQGARRAIKRGDPFRPSSYPIAGRATWERHLHIETEKKKMWERALEAISDDT